LRAFSKPFLIKQVDSQLSLPNEVDKKTGNAGAMILIHGGDISTKYAKVKQPPSSTVNEKP
jgi:murein L,D-transpeptidase YafK